MIVLLISLMSGVLLAQSPEFETYQITNRALPLYSNKIYFTPKLMTIEQWGVRVEDPYRGEHFITLIPTNKEVSRVLRALDKKLDYQCEIFGDLIKAHDGKQVQASEVTMTTYEIKNCK